MDGYNFRQLKAAILALSVADDWGQARIEWRLWETEESAEPLTCLCGHFPIIEICTLKNNLNGSFAEVGNICVNRFMGIDSQKVFDGIKRVRRDSSKSLTIDALAIAKERGFISAKDYAFYIDVRLKRKLSDAQLRWKRDVNDRVLRGLRRTRPDA